MGSPLLVRMATPTLRSQPTKAYMPIHQDIRFTTNADGVQLAMASYGRGRPIVRAAMWLTHIERDLDSSPQRQWIEELSRSHTFVTYDARGCGLSSRNPADISLDAWVSDLETVVDALRLETFPLIGFSQGAAVATAYAAKHPERVSRLVLFGAFVTSYFTTRNPDPKIAEEAEMLIKLMELGWGQNSPAFRRVFVAKFIPDATAEQQREFDEYQRLTVTPDVAARAFRAMCHINVKEDARSVKCPTLVFHSRGDQIINFEQGRKVAALIPGARFVPVDSENHIPYQTETCWPAIAQELRVFLGEQGVPARLTGRQLEVLRQVAAGQTDKQIARELNLSPRTVEMHVAGAMKSLGCATRAEAVHGAVTQGLLGP
jgi:pimeloyl-ACP methyl ester carboxylesterase/DNA-binding CsgD family transcriptional regulator